MNPGVHAEDAKEMNEVSRPVQIALLAVVLFAAAWFVALKPGDDAAPAPAPAETTAAAPAPAPTTPETTAAAPEPTTEAAAQPAGGTAATASVSEVAATGATRASTAILTDKGAAPTGDDDVVQISALPSDVRRAISRKKVVVLLFWNPKAADDRSVKASVRKTDRHGGKVFVKIDTTKHVSAYSGITGGAQVLQTPTIITVDRRKQARTLVGYVDSATLDQAVRAALTR
jgi:hypothetical protein